MSAWCWYAECSYWGGSLVTLFSLLCLGCLLPLKLLAAKQMPSYFCFSPFSIKVFFFFFQISFGLAKTRCLYRSFVKVKWQKANFWKARDTCISCSNPIINHSSRSLGSFYWKIVLEIKIQVLGVLIATGVTLILGLLSWLSKEIYLCILTYYIPVSETLPICHNLYLY